jgi:hypothetical protein
VLPQWRTSVSTNVLITPTNYSCATYLVRMVDLSSEWDIFGHPLTRFNGHAHNYWPPRVGLLTRRSTFLVRMVDLSSVSRHGPSERPQPFGIALWSLMPVLVVRHTLMHPLMRCNESVKHWGRPLDSYGDGSDVLAAMIIYEYFAKDWSCVFLVRRCREGKNMESRW